MDSNEFRYWIKGIVDSTNFMPTKKTWDAIVDKLETVEDDEGPEIHYSPQPIIPMPNTTRENPHEIICDAKEVTKGSADTGKWDSGNNVYKDELL